MPEYLRSLMVVLTLSIAALIMLRKPLTAGLIDSSDYRLRASLWVTLTVAAFVAHSFWLFVLIATVLVLIVGIADSNRIALYAFVVLAVPSFRANIEGFAGINRFIDLDYLRLLAVFLLLPIALKLVFRADRARLFKLPADKYLLAYLGLQLAITSQITSNTDLLRTTVTFAIDVWLPYYVFSRGLDSPSRMREVFAAFTAGCSVLAVIALFEVLKGWLLYSSLPATLGLRWSYGGYMYRDAALRAVATSGHSIYLGYVLAVAMGLHLSLRSFYASRRAWVAVLVLLALGVAVTLARGPWIGAAAVLLISLTLEPKSKAVYGRVALAAVVLVPILMATPIGARIQSFLPFVGQYDAGSVDYRQQLFLVSWDVLMMNPILGSPFYLSTPEMETMRQGEGIIDMVNTYLGVALATGVVGLLLFMGVFASSAWQIWLALKRSLDKDGEEHRMGRSLLATTAGIAVTIATVGNENPVGLVFWCVAGACAAYAHHASHPAAAQSMPFARGPYAWKSES